MVEGEGKGEKDKATGEQINSAPAGGRVWGGKGKKLRRSHDGDLVLSEPTRTTLEPLVASSGGQHGLYQLARHVPFQVPHSPGLLRG